MDNIFWIDNRWNNITVFVESNNYQIIVLLTRQKQIGCDQFNYNYNT